MFYIHNLDKRADIKQLRQIYPGTGPGARTGSGSSAGTGSKTGIWRNAESNLEG